MIDLHIHTTASSDGAHDPAEIFKMAKALDLKAIAFADHNTMGSVEKGLELAAQNGMSFVTGIEINTLHQGWDLHLLAYGFDPADPNFGELLEKIEKSEWDQARRRLAKLAGMGFVVDWEDVLEKSGGLPPSGMSFIQAILSRSENNGDHRLDRYRPGGSRADSPYLNFYLDYLRGGKPGFVPQEGVSTVDIIKTVKDMGAVPVLAHPSDTPVEFIGELVAAGLMGLEVYSSYHDDELPEKWRSIAGEHALLMTAGSDFHGEKVKPGVALGDIPCNDMELFQKLIDAIENKNGVVT